MEANPPGDFFCWGEMIKMMFGCLDVEVQTSIQVAQAGGEGF